MIDRQEESYLPAWDLTTSNVLNAAWAIFSSSSGNILSNGRNWSRGSRKHTAPMVLCALAEPVDISYDEFQDEVSTFKAQGAKVIIIVHDQQILQYLRDASRRKRKVRLSLYPDGSFFRLCCAACPRPTLQNPVMTMQTTKTCIHNTSAFSANSSTAPETMKNISFAISPAR